MKIEPLNDEILIVPIQKEDKTPGGLIVPSIADKGPTELGEVLAVGDGILLQDGRYQKPSVVSGDVVIYDRNAAVPVDNDGKRYHFVRVANLHGKITKG